MSSGRAARGCAGCPRRSTSGSRARPERIRHGSTRRGTGLGTGVGAFTGAGDTLWLGTNFYDGEGDTRVGAVGSFALGSRRYALRYPRALADWSTSALAVDGGALWLGLVGPPKGADYGGGVLPVDRLTGGTRRYAVPGVVTALAVWGETVAAGTTNALYVPTSGRFTPLAISFDSHGRETDGSAR
jgi:hypothetical protein